MCLNCAILRNEIDMDLARRINNNDIRETYDHFYDAGMPHGKIIQFFDENSWDKTVIEEIAVDTLEKYRKRKAEREAINADVGIYED